ncbi:MAG TPA: flavin reductase family protein [Methanocellaceae archaeon]|jgi:flavin reductase (DIM6/NTAB) family NADH-FMN oxidoreductase RutF
MDKVKLGAKTLMYPMPAVLVGTNVKGKPNYMTAAWCGIACMAPPMIAVAINHARQTAKGIEENKTFSINIPAVRQAIEVDHCGIVTGAHGDKSKVFEPFYGTLKTAPMAKECPVNIECKLHTAVDLGSHSLYIGEIMETYVDNEAIVEGAPSVEKVDPLIYADGKYYGIGKFVTKAFSAGKEYKK